MAYGAEAAAGKIVIEGAGIPDEDGTVFRATFRRGGEVTTVIVSCVNGVWYIAGHIPVNAPRTYGSLCAFFGRVEVLEITRYAPVK